MRVLLDNNVNQRFGAFLSGHEVVHVRAVGLDRHQNGDLIAAAEAAGFETLVTCDKNMSYQQNITSRKLRIVVLNSRRITLPHLVPLAPQSRLCSMAVSSRVRSSSSTLRSSGRRGRRGSTRG